MEGQCSLNETKQFIGRRFWRRALDTLMIGVLFGALAGVPYGQWFGLPAALQFAVQSMISVVAFASLLAHWPTEIDLEQACFL
jgi:hypothetical protein